MKICCDTSILVDIDRQKKETVELLKSCMKNNHELFISIATVAEILTGAHLQQDKKKSLQKAKNSLPTYLRRHRAGD